MSVPVTIITGGALADSRHEGLADSVWRLFAKKRMAPSRIDRELALVPGTARACVTERWRELRGEARP